MKREDINYWLHDSPQAQAEQATELWEVKQAAETATKLSELIKAGKFPLECALVVGESLAMIQILSRALSARSA